MRIFENPSNKHREYVSGHSWLFALLFGIFYFAVKGLWRHVFIQLVVIILFGVLSGGPGALIAIPLWIGYAIGSESILAGGYLRSGWVEVSEPERPSDTRWDRLGLVAEAHERGERYRAPSSSPSPSSAPTPPTMNATSGAADDAGHPSIATELSKLADLKERGLLSDAEFEAGKKQVLSRSS